MDVSRETISATVGRFPVPDAEATAEAVERLLAALAAERDPPTTVRDPARALDVHVADSLSAVELPVVRAAERLADIGAGAGFPGLVLAAGLPGLQADLIEATRRKCEVIDRLAAAAGLEARVRAVPARAEEWAKDEGAVYDLVTARALAPLAVICEYAAPLLRIGGHLVAWKGAVDQLELDGGERAASELGLARSEIVSTDPFPDSRSHSLHVYSKVRETPSQYPRRVGVASKKPIG